jgi:hypothetical protein
MSDGKKQQKNGSDSIKQRRFHVLPPGDHPAGLYPLRHMTGNAEIIPDAKSTFVFLAACFG